MQSLRSCNISAANCLEKILMVMINLIASIEIFIGLFTLSGMAFYIHLGRLAKPPNVLTFVTVTAVVSTLLGLGLLRRNKMAVTLLVFFSGYIILTKVMVATGLVHFNGAILEYLPTDLKNLVSALYHFVLIVLLTKPSVQKELR
jgi:TRAP-type uncharacterized transport system fused permease subunit